MQPLVESQIQEYLIRTKRPELWASIKDKPELLKLAQTPLFLQVIIRVKERLLSSILTGWFPGMSSDRTIFSGKDILGGFLTKTKRLFLQRVGGRYRFIHDLLREHFAQMELDQK